MQFERVVRFRGGDIGLIELDGRGCESALGVATLALQARSRTDGGGDGVGFVVGVEIGINVRFLFGVSNAHSVRRSLGGLKCIGDGQCDVLAVIANNVVLKWRPALVGNAFESLSRYRAENLSNILAMKYGSDVWPLLGRRRVPF